jgi:hypothetical protein
VRVFFFNILIPVSPVIFCVFIYLFVRPCRLRGLEPDETAVATALAGLAATLEVYERILGTQKFIAGDVSVFFSPLFCSRMLGIIIYNRVYSLSHPSSHPRSIINNLHPPIYALYLRTPPQEFTLADLFHVAFGAPLAAIGCDLMTTSGPNVARCVVSSAS